MVTSSYNKIKFVHIYGWQIHQNNYTMCRLQNLSCLNFNKPWALGSQNRACSLQLTTCHSIMIDIVLMIHRSGNLIWILSYSGISSHMFVDSVCGRSTCSNAVGQHFPQLWGTYLSLQFWELLSPISSPPIQIMNVCSTRHCFPHC